jgi:hypothetical protein
MRRSDPAQALESHVKLSEGQGAELLWRKGRKTSSRSSACGCMRWTAPAFDAALYSGIVLAAAWEVGQGLSSSQSTWASRTRFKTI